jgi:hypothetical protein
VTYRTCRFIGDVPVRLKQAAITRHAANLFPDLRGRVSVSRLVKATRSNGPSCSQKSARACCRCRPLSHMRSLCRSDRGSPFPYPITRNPDGLPLRIKLPLSLPEILSPSLSLSLSVSFYFEQNRFKNIERNVRASRDS